MKISGPEATVGSPPDRVSIDRDSPYFYRESRLIDVYLDDVRRPYNTTDYCVSEGWLITVTGRILRGLVEARWRPQPAPTPRPQPSGLVDHRARAEARRARRAERNLKLSGARAR